MKEENQSRSHRFNKKDVLVSLILFFVILSLHGVLIFLVLPEKGLFLKYPLLSQLYLQGQLSEERLYDLSPLYFYFHIALRLLFQDPIKIVFWIQIVLTAFAGAMLFHLLRRFFSTLIALAGIAAFALNPSIIIYTNTLEPECMLTLFLILFAFFETKRTLSSMFIAGIFFGLGLLLRANFIPLLVVVPFYFYLHKKSSRELLFSTFAFLLPVLLSIGFLMVRNASLHGDFTPFVMNPGCVFFEGNNPNSTGKSAVYPPLFEDMIFEYPNVPDSPHMIYRSFAKSAADKDLSVVEVNDFWTEKAQNFILDHPIRFVKLLALKAQFFFHSFRRHDLPNAYYYDQEIQKRSIPSIPFWVISILAFGGMIFNRKNWKRDFLYYFIFFTQFGILLIIYVSARQRVSILPFLILFALHGLCYGFKRWRNAALVVLLLIPGYFLFYVKTDLMAEEEHLLRATREYYDHLAMAKKESAVNNIEGACSHASRALARNPWRIEDSRPAFLPFHKEGYVQAALKASEDMHGEAFSSRFDRATLLLEAGELVEGEKIFLRLIEEGHSFQRDYHQSSQPHYYLGLIEEKRGRKASAIQQFEKAIERAPGSPFSLSHLYALTGKEEYKDQLSRYFDSVSAAFFLGKAFLSAGDLERAREYLSFAVKKIPACRKALIYYAVVLGALRQYDQAATVYLTAMKKRPGPVFFEKQVLAFFEEWSEQDPKSHERKYYRGLVLHQFGLYEEALQVLQEARILAPANKQIAEELEILQRLCRDR